MSDKEGLEVGRGPNICLSKESLCNVDGTLAVSEKGKLKNPNLGLFFQTKRRYKTGISSYP